MMGSGVRIPLAAPPNYMKTIDFNGAPPDWRWPTMCFGDHMVTILSAGVAVKEARTGGC